MLRRLSWLPLRTSLVLAALAAVALVALTFGLLRIVSANSAEIAHVRAEAEAEILASKIASLPAGLSDEERDGEILTLVAARARRLVGNPLAIRIFNRTGGTLLVGAGIATVAVRSGN